MTPTRSDGALRRVGVELEFQGIALEAVAELIAATLDGKTRRISRAEYAIDAGEAGDFRAEIDYEALKRYAREHAANRESETSAIDRLALDLFAELSALVVPCEIITPPLSLADLGGTVDAITASLRDAGAKGTGQSVVYAFGLHLNIDPPSLETESITAALKAFVLLFDWLQWREQVDLARRATSYVSRFPADYENLLTEPDYWPDREGLIRDYLHFNPTRNRALDMLPLFAHLDEDRVRQAVDDPRIAPRPAFHYRLANCRIDEPGWSVAEHWNRWLAIETLASRRDELQEAATAFQEDRRRVLHLIDNEWRRLSERWVTEPSSA